MPGDSLLLVAIVTLVSLAMGEPLPRVRRAPVTWVAGQVSDWVTGGGKLLLRDITGDAAYLAWKSGDAWYMFSPDDDSLQYIILSVIHLPSFPCPLHATIYCP